ncbi:MAG: glycine cleavage system aminomethyltransferase GcvT [Candidatus Omnitrophica bacterium]|nr:glycine cleavage system aminomethyltransferase GcvT [Candidatus Omnitrophota bacterium]
MMDLKETPLIDEHRSLGAKLAPFGGWLMPIQYSGIIAEHNWTRKEVSVFDICHMGEFTLRGDAVKSGLSSIVTFDIVNLPVAGCRYGFMLNEAGGIIDDLIVYRIGAEEWMIVVNAATIDGDEAHFRKHLAAGADFKNISSVTAKLDLQGPKSLDILKKLTGSSAASLAYYTFGHFRLLGEKVIISRTGYTGELGYEIYISAGKVAELWKALLKDPRVKPAGLGARDTLRLEMCYPLYGQDLTAETTPVEADKGRFVDMKKDFIGRSALVNNKKPYRRLINFTAASRRAPRHNYRIFAGGKDAGIVTSGSFSPSLSCGIGMGYVSIPCAAGTEITLKEGDIEIQARAVKGPFYKNGTAKMPEGSHAGT